MADAQDRQEHMPTVDYAGVMHAQNEVQLFSRSQGRFFGPDSSLRFLTGAAAVLILVLLVSLIFVLLPASWTSIKETGLGFLLNETWRPLQVGDQPEEYGAAAVIWGTAVSSMIALIVAVPLSFGAAIFLVRTAPRWLVPPVSFLIEFLAAIPSIAYGIWGLFVLAPFLRGNVGVPDWLEWAPETPGLTWLFEPSQFGETNEQGEPLMFFRGLESIIIDWATTSETTYVRYDEQANEVIVPASEVDPSLVGNEIFEITQREALPGLDWLVTTETPFGGEQVVSANGTDMLAGGLILAIMIIPIITAISRDVLKAIPRQQIEGTIALGATWWQSVKEMLKFSRSALFGAVMLGLARAAGETMAVTFVIGGNIQLVLSPFKSAETMSSLLANQFGEAVRGTLKESALMEVALILLVMSLLVNMVARYFVVGGNSRTAAAH